MCGTVHDCTSDENIVVIGCTHNFQLILWNTAKETLEVTDDEKYECPPPQPAAMPFEIPRYGKY